MKRNFRTSLIMTMMMRRIGPKLFVNCSIRRKRLQNTITRKAKKTGI